MYLQGCQADGVGGRAASVTHPEGGREDLKLETGTFVLEVAVNLERQFCECLDRDFLTCEVLTEGVATRERCDDARKRVRLSADIGPRRHGVGRFPVPVLCFAVLSDGASG